MGASGRGEERAEALPAAVPGYVEVENIEKIPKRNVAAVFPLLYDKRQKYVRIRQKCGSMWHG